MSQQLYEMHSAGGHFATGNELLTYSSLPFAKRPGRPPLMYGHKSRAVGAVEAAAGAAAGAAAESHLSHYWQQNIRMMAHFHVDDNLNQSDGG
ncbi:hypothetical protein LSTR_LSTR015618 [Laodelphax striatellus]|uniref:Uncharacterized protein n=1 Tax=Laodelphax striatellus TaxID=195883 RepID=A0A482X8G6_LAOST|nr:hypothetical protein LSTR_LSTR015618 [Laodelphax striatellus]